jgi:hypothetical protein
MSAVLESEAGLLASYSEVEYQKLLVSSCKSEDKLPIPVRHNVHEISC